MPRFDTAPLRCHQANSRLFLGSSSTESSSIRLSARYRCGIPSLSLVACPSLRVKSEVRYENSRIFNLQCTVKIKGHVAIKSRYFLFRYIFVGIIIELTGASARSSAFKCIINTKINSEKYRCIRMRHDLRFQLYTLEAVLSLLSPLYEDFECYIWKSIRY